MIWLLEKQIDKQPLLKNLLSGSFTIRAIASVESFLIISKITDSKHFPSIFLVNGGHFNLLDLDHEAVRTLIEKGVVLACYGNEEGRLNELFTEIRCDLERLPFYLQDLRFINANREAREKISYQIDFEAKLLFCKRNKMKVSLSFIEARILNQLLKNFDLIVTRENLIETAWQNNTVSNRTIDSYISRIRKKLENTSLEIDSIYRSGYLLKDNSRIS